MNVTVTVQHSADLQSKLDHLEDRAGLNAEMGIAVEDLVRTHIVKTLIPKGNALGGPSTGFWKKAADSIEGTSNGNEATVRITARGVALQYYGGRVFPSGRISDVTGRPITRLAIPISASAHGKRPGDFPKGELVLKGNVLTLGGTALFALVRSATIKPHPEVLPTESEICATATESAVNYLLRKLK